MSVECRVESGSHITPSANRRVCRSKAILHQINRTKSMSSQTKWRPVTGEAVGGGVGRWEQGEACERRHSKAMTREQNEAMHPPSSQTHRLSHDRPELKALPNQEVKLHIPNIRAIVPRKRFARVQRPCKVESNNTKHGNDDAETKANVAL